MAEHNLLRGKVISYPTDDSQGLVEVQIGSYQEEQDTVLARMEHSVSGLYWLPEVEDIVEVEVPDVPGYEARIVHIHRGEDGEQAQECWTQTNDLKQLRTRSGHAVTLDDTQDKTSILIRSAGGLTARLNDEDSTVTVKGEQDEPVLCLDMEKDEARLAVGKKLTIQCGGATIEIDSSGNISIQAKGNLELNAQNITIDAKSKLTAKAQQVEVSGAMQAKVEGKSQLEVSSSGITTVKGSLIKLN